MQKKHSTVVEFVYTLNNVIELFSLTASNSNHKRCTKKSTRKFTDSGNLYTNRTLFTKKSYIQHFLKEYSNTCLFIGITSKEYTLIEDNIINSQTKSHLGNTKTSALQGQCFTTEQT